jgi:membrane protein CcdC involved in cytochrome C biogenesis
MFYRWKKLEKYIKKIEQNKSNIEQIYNKHGTNIKHNNFTMFYRWKKLEKYIKKIEQNKSNIE